MIQYIIKYLGLIVCVCFVGYIMLEIGMGNVLRYIVHILIFIGGAYFAGYIAKQVAFYWKKREDDVQIKIEQVKETKKGIEDVCKRIVTLSSERQYDGLTLIDYIQDKYSEQDIANYRDFYRKSVQNWNAEIQKIFLDLHHFGLQIEAIEIETKLHKLLFNSHICFKHYWGDNNLDNELLRKAKKLLEESQNETKNVSVVLYKKANQQLFQIDDFYKEDLIVNKRLYRANILELVKFVFYRRKNSFYVSGSF